MPVDVGINYNYFATTRTTISECRADREPQTAGTWFLPVYNDPGVRATVRVQLRAMRDSGFTSLRTVVFHGHSEDPDPTAFTSMDGSISAGDRRKLREFVADVAAAGYKALEVVPDFGAENDVYCRNRTWGDCFEPQRTAENWRFIEGVASEVNANAGGMRVRVDLGNEKAPDPAMPPHARAAAKTYVQTLARNYAREFGDNWLFSAARSDASPSTETVTRQQLLIDDLAEAGLHPKFLETHNYSGDGSDVYESLGEMETLAEHIGAQVVVGELRYHSAVQARAIAGWLSAHPASRLIDVSQWPEYDPTNICAIDPDPPYTPGPLGTAIGGTL